MIYDQLNLSKVFAAANSAAIVKNYLAPTINDLSLIGAIICALFLIIGGYHYITSSGNPANLQHAKKVIKHALIGLVIILAAVCLNNLLVNAYGPVNGAGVTPSVPSLSAIKPQSSSAIIDIIIKTISGVLGSIIETVAVPFLKALSYFTSGTPLIASNPSIFNLWLSIVGMTDALFTLVIILLGLHVMSFATIGIDEINIKQLIPRIGLAFLLINSSLFIIDSVISLSNLLIRAVSNSQSVATVWQVLEAVIKQPSAYDLAALIIMVIFLVFSVILLIYYVGRIVTLYLGAVLAPLILLCWLLPSLRDFALTAAKRYITTIFVLFVHVIILELAASLLAGMISNSNQPLDPLMAMIVGLATLVALLKTQGVMAQLSYAAIGPRTARMVAERLVLNLSYLGAQTSQAVGHLLPSTGVPYNQRYIESKYNSFNPERSTKTTTDSPNNIKSKPPTSNLKPTKVNGRGHQKS